MTGFERHLFVCVNERDCDHPRGCCLAKGAKEVAQALKVAAYERGLKGRMRVNKAGCLDHCETGVSVVVYPEGIWYGGVTLADVDEIIERTLMKGEVIDRLVVA